MRAEQVTAGKTGAEKRWAFLEGMDVGADGDPYLDRLRIFQTPWINLYLHHIHRPDRDSDPHDHPWSFASLVLAGSYEEDVWPVKGKPRAWSPRRRCRFSLHYMSRKSAHIITQVDGPLWTMVVTGPRRAGWGFWRRSQFIPWREYTAEGQ